MGPRIERQLAADGTARLVLHGEFDLAVRCRLRAALDGEDRDVVVVTDDLDHIDSACLGELVRGCERARSAGRRFTVTPGFGSVHHLLRISGVFAYLSGAAT